MLAEATLGGGEMARPIAEGSMLSRSPGLLKSISTGVLDIGADIWSCGLFWLLLSRPKPREPRLVRMRLDSWSPNLLLRTHRARKISPIAKATVATTPIDIPAIWTFVSRDVVLAALGGLEDVADAGDVSKLVVGVELIESVKSNELVRGGVGLLVIIDFVTVAVGTIIAPVPDGMTRVATMVECVCGAALATLEHISYAFNTA